MENTTAENTAMKNGEIVEPNAAEQAAPEAAAKVECTEQKAPVVMLERADFETLINGFRAYYDALLRTVKVTKEKDVTMAKITKELQKYREGYAKSLTKPIALSLISFLEDSKKTLREIESFAKSKDSVLKYLDYIVADVEAIMELYDITAVDGGFTVKNKPISEWQEPAKSELPDPKPIAEELMPAYDSEIPSLAAALEFMKMGQVKVEEAVRQNARLDANLDAYANVAAAIDKHNASALLMPIYRKLAGFYQKMTSLVECAKADLERSEGDFVVVYKVVLESAVDYVYDMLLFIGVTVIDDISDDFDVKTSKILNIVNTPNAELDKKICARYTSCYQIDGAIIYPAKVSVYKFAQE